MKEKLIICKCSTTWINAYKHSNTEQPIDVHTLINLYSLSWSENLSTLSSPSGK